MFIAEAPGGTEDRDGRPLIGKAGTLFRKMVKAIEIDISNIYLANILKCHPPDNRKPFQHEIDECKRFVMKQIDIIKPSYIICLGKTAIEGLLPDRADNSVTSLRSVSKSLNSLIFHDIPVIVTYHPSALLRSPKYRPLANEDFKFIQKISQETIIRKKTVRLEEQTLFADPL